MSGQLFTNEATYDQRILHTMVGIREIRLLREFVGEVSQVAAFES
jgi:hypothetical protein